MLPCPQRAQLSWTRVLIVVVLLNAFLGASQAAESSSSPSPSTKRPKKAKTTTTTTTTTTSTTTVAPLISSTEGNGGDDDTVASTTIGIPQICVHGIRVEKPRGSDEDHDTPANVLGDRDLVQVIEGDAMLSVMTADPTSALFAVNRVNQVNLLEADFEVGIRAILVDDESLAENFLMQEVEYLQQCVTHAIGIFMDFDLYERLEGIIKDLEYNIWAIPSTRTLIFPKVAHLLYQMPWGDQIASVEILTENLGIYNEFMEAVRHEHMCLMHFKSDNNVYIVFGNNMAKHFQENGTVFAVPTERLSKELIDELPKRSFVLLERELDLRLIGENTTQVTLDELLLGKTVLPSRLLAFASPLITLMRWLKSSLHRNCKQAENVFVLETCTNLLAFVGDWNGGGGGESSAEGEAGPQLMEVGKILDMLGLRRYAPLMELQMQQKSSGSPPALRDIASQSFVTNVTSYYYHNSGNTTSVELKTKFGQVFNCQYSGGSANPRYPFLFDGESVMFWRIKTDAWVAAGMTASILGVIVTLAILVFIVVRISLGDVFEGNPITSILLLLSLVLVFTSFVPFAMEYVGEHRNSHVTFEDAATLNTLCSVRVFVMTLVYCFTFSLLLCRAVMLASIGSEGGFLSHVNGYIQAVICLLSILVQLGMSVQMLVVMHVAAADDISCETMYYGHWLWVLMGYDLLLLACIVALVPFIYRSQRNYREGILIVIGGVLTFIMWVAWIVMSMFGDEMRDAAIALGLQATGWAILIGVLIPRTFLIVRGIERSDIAQALPSLTSLAFAQNNQYSSEQSVYECVNPAMRHCSQEDIAHHQQSPSEIPTLPLRGGGPRRQQFFANLRQANANINPPRPPPQRPQRRDSAHSSQSSLPPTPDSNKITRF